MALRRLDDCVAQQLSVTRSHARSLIMEGRVRVDGVTMTKGGQHVRLGATIDITTPRRYVSRGGEKLAAALAAFAIDAAGMVALDVGASTGGFTDCLLQHGAARVVALDVGYGQLDWSLRTNPQVEVRERTNVRLLPADAFPDGFDLIVIDASFISLRSVIPSVIPFLREAATIVALIKPQFEAGRDRLGTGGVVRDPEVHRMVVREVRSMIADLGLTMTALCASPLRGPAGNREFLARIQRSGAPVDDATLDAAIEGE